MMNLTGKTFELTQQHLLLARRMFVQWQDCETGAPEIDPKRPYGNSDVAGDVHELLTGEIVDNDEVVLNRQQREDYLRLHAEMEDVVQILLVNAGAAVSPGTYIQEDKYNSTSWKSLG